MPGFGTTADRSKFLEKLRHILLKAYGAAYHSVAGLTSNKRVGGLPRLLVNALLCNIDARIHLLERHPALSNCLVEYMLDTDDIEFNFSALAKRATWNAPAEQQLRLLRSIRRLARLRRDKNSGVSLQHSKHRKYGPERRSLKRGAEWHSCDPKVRKKHHSSLSEAALRCVRDKRHVRGFRKANQL